MFCTRLRAPVHAHTSGLLLCMLPPSFSPTCMPMHIELAVACCYLHTHPTCCHMLLPICTCCCTLLLHVLCNAAQLASCYPIMLTFILVCMPYSHMHTHGHIYPYNHAYMLHIKPQSLNHTCTHAWLSMLHASALPAHSTTS